MNLKGKILSFGEKHKAIVEEWPSVLIVASLIAIIISGIFSGDITMVVHSGF